MNNKPNTIANLGSVTLSEDTINSLLAILETNDFFESNITKPNKFTVLKDTSHIIFKFIDSFELQDSYAHHHETKYYEKYQSIFMPIVNEVTAMYGYANPKHSRIMLANLSAGGKIISHTDGKLDNPSLTYPHKVHVPIKTNPNCMFTVENDSINMLVGEAYEVNNAKPHKVENDGDSDRLHLIFELYDNQ